MLRASPSQNLINLGAALCRRPSFHGVGWSVVDACKNDGMQACEIAIHAVVVAATNFQESCLAVDWLAVGSRLAHHVTSCPSHCKEMQLAFCRIRVLNLYIRLYSVKWALCFSALLLLHPHVKRRCCLKSTVYSLFTHVVNRTRTVLLGFSNVNQWH